MKSWSVRQRIITGFSAVILVMVALSAFAYVRLRGSAAQAAALDGDSVPGLYLVGRLQAVSIQTYISAEQHVSEHDPDQMRQIMAYIQQKTVERLDLLKQYEPTITTGKGRELFEASKAALATYMVVRGQVLKLSADPKTKPQAATLLRDQLAPLYDKLQDALQTEVDFNKANAFEDSERIRGAVGSTQSWILVSLILGLAFALTSGYLLAQAINQPLARLVSAIEAMRLGDFSERLKLVRNDEFGVLASGFNGMADSLQGLAEKTEQVAAGNLAIAVEPLSKRDVMGNALAGMIEKLSSLIRGVQQSGLQVNTSATEIAATAQEQLSTANEIAATTSEIGATSKEISATSKELVHTMKEVTSVAEKTASLAGSGQSGLARMKTTMQQITEASAAINARLAVLSEKAGNISNVVTTITKVADQTNLLSLNAAIEAEKAGDYGRGFAVVATEIRRLADQTAVATSDIEQTVKEMQSAAAAGVMGMDKFAEEVRRGVEVVHQVGEELSQIIQQVQTLTPNFETVSEGMQSQSLGAQQISDSLAQLSDAAKQTVESLRQSNLAIDQLNDAARRLQVGVSKFTVAV
jgi:methyl-accepting chemotaxis protein WspA